MNKSTILLVALLVILGAVTYYLLPSQKEHETSYEPQNTNLKVDSASIVKIEIQQKSKSAVIENVGGKWMITSPIHYAADGTAIKQLLSGLSKFRVGSLVSSNPEKQNIFQVDSTGTRVAVTDRSGKSITMIVGKMGPSFSEVYFRVPSSSDVYLGEGLDTWTINKEVREWRDKSIISTPSESIKELSYGVLDKHFQFQHDTSGWKSGGVALDAGTMNPALNQIANLHADDFVDSLMKMETRPIELGVHGTEDVTLNLFPSSPDSSKYYVRASNSPQLFVISKWTAEQLLKPVAQTISPSKASIAGRKPPVPRPSPTVADQKKEPEMKRPQPPVAVKKEPEVKRTQPPVAVKKEPEMKPTQPPVAVKKEPEMKRTEPPVAVTKTPPAGGLKSDSIATGTHTVSPSKSSNQPARKADTTPNIAPATPSGKSSEEDEGELTVHTVKKSETMTTIAKQYNVTVEQILRWNLLKSIEVKPGQELYIYLKK
jgi:LysM repeat protein